MFEVEKLKAMGKVAGSDEESAMEGHEPYRVGANFS